MRAIKYLEKHAGFTRLALHAHCLTLAVPDAPLPLTILSGGLPPDMLYLLARDR
jgi:hypothetical protein